MIRAVREQACESQTRFGEWRGESDILKGRFPKARPGVSFIPVGDLAKAFYHMPVHRTIAI